MNKNLKHFFIVLFSMAVSAMLLPSCSKDSPSPGVTTPPVDTTDTTHAITPLGGYTSSDSVAAANLVAYWPFDGNANDVKGGQTASAVQVTYTTGLRGQAWQGGDSVYATIPASSGFSGLSSYSYSEWYKLAAQPAAGNPGGMFFLTGTTTPDELIYEIEPNSPVSGDSVKIHHGFNDLASPAYQLFVLESYDTSAIGNWVHLVTTYDGATSIYTIYQNGVPIGNKSAFSMGGYITPTHMYTDGTMTTDLGNLGFSTDPPSQVILGTWPAGLFGVSSTLGENGNFMGQMDEIRVFNKALSQTEVIGLYLNGLAHR